MSDLDYDDPDIEADWCAEMRAQVFAYLDEENVAHARIGEWPAWHVAPYVSVWAVESATEPDVVGCWVLCGDLPTDYVLADSIASPRDAIRAIAERWSRHAMELRSGETPQEVEIHGMAEEQDELLPLLENRAEVLLEWAADDELWAEA